MLAWRRRKTVKKIAPFIEKPARYAGGELNAVKKTDFDVHFAMCFPDIYEVGMSHIGLNLLYELLNAEDAVFAERIFAPWKDMGRYLKKNGMRLSSLETDTPMCDFDIVGFNLSYEMGYTNVLYMLDLGGMPLFARDRGDDLPVVAGGGSCVVNPEPVADFFDVFVLGDGEEASAELCRIYAKHKKAGFDKRAFLRELSALRGFYVPSFYNVTYHTDGRVARIIPDEGVPPKVMRRVLHDFDTAFMITKPVLPFVNTVHDRCVLEIMRGCTRGCRFCQAGYIYRPVRERGADRLLSQAREIIKNTGYDEISLASLSSGDYSDIGYLAGALLDEFAEKKVSVALPSMRVDSFAPEVAAGLQQVRNTGVTFAPEAGTQRLRDVINKNITEEDILSTVKNAMMSGVNTIKLYFMIGLPTETYDDLDGIVSLVKKIKDIYYEVPREVRRGAVNINVSVSSFVPKPQTPFMWEAQDKRVELCSKQEYLRSRLKIKGVKFSCHDSETSFLEAVFARGDRRLSAVLNEAYKKGCIFDSWKECFDMEKWNKVFLKCGIDPSWYANRQRAADEVMPFEHIDFLVDRSFMLKELENAKAAVAVPDCRKACLRCGLQKHGCLMHGGAKA